MIALIPLFPFAGFVVNAFLGRRLPKTISGGLASLMMIASFAVSVGIVLDYDAAGNLVGIDIDHASAKVQLNRLVVSRLPATVETEAG